MSEALGVVAFALLFSVFGVLQRRSGGEGCVACDGQSCGACRDPDPPAAERGARGGGA
jgi:hypothetical protein